MLISIGEPSNQTATHLPASSFNEAELIHYMLQLGHILLDLTLLLS